LVKPKEPPRLQIFAIAPAKPSALLAAMVVFTTSNGCPRVVTSNIFKPAPSNKLLNFTGFFSSFGGAATPAMVAVGADIIWEDSV